MIDALRKKAMDRFHEIGLPRPKQEAFQYLRLAEWALPSETAPVRPFPRENIEPHILPECKTALLVFVDGYFDETLSDFSSLPRNVVCLPLDAAMKSYGLFLQNRITRSLKEEEDPFAALNGAMHGKGAFLYVPPQTRVETPLQILNLQLSPHLSAMRLQLFLGKESHLHLAQTTVSFAKTTSSDLIDAVLDPSSSLHIDECSNLPTEAKLFHSLRATLRRDAVLSHMQFTSGSTRHSLRVSLAEEGAEAKLQGLSLLDGRRESHIHVLVEHQAPSCRSRQHFKSVLRAQSRASFEGKIFVRPIAQKTEAYQLNNNLVLSDEAAAYAKPNLEIFADDVKASHGATFFQLNDEEIFYLQTRGLSAAEAKTHLVAGFCADMIERFKTPSLRQAIP